MKFYVASGIKNKDGVQGACDLIRNAGHEVLVDWAIEQQIPQKDREHHSVEVRATSVRDAEGIRNCDVFVLLSDPPEGRSMYVEPAWPSLRTTSSEIRRSSLSLTSAMRQFSITTRQ